MHRSIRAKVFAAAILGLATAAGAQTIQWNAAASGTFSVGANWVGGVAPSALNNANFGVAGSYTVTFISPASNTSLGVSLGNVTFSGAQPYSLGNLATINGGSLTLNFTDISSAAMSVNGNSRLTISATSEWSATDISVGNLSANNGTILLNGGTISSSTALSLGLNGGDGTVSLTSGTTANFNQINLANSGVAGSGGTLLVANTSNVTATGAINIGNGGVASQVGLLRQSDSTTFTQTGAVGMTIGAAANSAGTLDLVSGTFTTGTGTITINPTGVVRVGAGGVFNANGNITMNGGVFDFSAGTATFAANQIITLNNGAQVLPTLGFGFEVNSGRTWNVNNSSIDLAGNFDVDIGTAGNGSMIVNAGTIDATGFGVLTMGAAGATGTLSLLNGSVGNFNSLSSVAGAVRINVAGGSTLSFNNVMNIIGAGPSSISVNSGGVMSLTRMTLNNGTLFVADAASRVTMGSIDLQASGAMNVSGGSVAIGSGTSLLSGTLTLTGGSIQFAGPLSMNNGDIVVTAPGILRPFAGAATLNNSRLTAPNFTTGGTFIADSNSLIQASVVALGGATNRMSNGSDMVVSGNFDLAHQTAGVSTLTMQHAGTTLTVGGQASIGGAGEGTLILTDSAAGTFSGGLDLADETSSFNTGVVTIDSSATAFLGDDLRIATQISGPPPVGSVTISNGGVMTLSGSNASLVMGAASNTAATLTVNPGGRFVMNPAAFVSLNATGTILVNGGEALLGTFLSNPAGKILFNSGTLGTNGVLNVAPGGALGSTLTLGPDRALHHGGTLTINNGTVAINGGTLTVGTFGASTSGINFQSGHLNVTSGFTLGNGHTLGRTLTLTPDRSLNVFNQFTISTEGELTVDGGRFFGDQTTVIGRLIVLRGQADISTLINSGGVSIGRDAQLRVPAVNNSGRIELGGGLARLDGSIVNNNNLIVGHGEIDGTLNNFGELRADVGQTLLISGVLNLNSGRITANGGRVEFLNNITNVGSIDLTSGVLWTAGSLNNTSSGRVTGRGTIVANSISNAGTMTFSSGVSDVNVSAFTNSGKAIITGTSVTTFFGAVTNNSGSELRVSTGATAVFLGNVTGASFITGGGAKIFEAGASGLLSTPGDSIVEAFGNLSLQHIRERSLTINGGVVQIQSDGTATGVSRLSELSIAGAPSNWDGQFNLSNNSLIVDYATISPKTTVIDHLKTGFANGAWNGQGISSAAAASQPNRAIGIAEAADVGSPSIFLGQSVDSTSLLLRFTLPGDANLDGIVNITDFALLAANFNTPSYWAKGDFNYNGVTNINDFALLASNFNQTLQTDLPRSTVPEPIGMSLLSLTSIARRRRCSNHR